MSTRPRHAVVTGAASGIGRAVALTLAEKDMKVTGLDRHPCPDVAHRQVDLADLDATAALAAELDDEAPVDVFVSCAGIFEGQLAADLRLDAYQRTLAINLHAPVLLMSAFAARMAARGHGRIVAVTSVHVRFSEPTAMAYDVGKGGLDAAVRTIAVEHATDGVLVNAVAPGFVKTGMSIVDGVDETETPWFEESFIKTGRLAIGRVAHPNEIASAISYLVSDENTYITGTSLTVDGGLSARF